VSLKLLWNKGSSVVAKWQNFEGRLDRMSKEDFDEIEMD
jgi:hypothetical protein